MEYDPSHKASSISSSASYTSDSLPSFYTGRADSISSEIDDFLPQSSSKEHFVFTQHYLGRHSSKELLSEEQKKANHTASEQKRRNTIRGGFRELSDLVPTLKNTNHSKSIILFKSAEYIKQVSKRNKRLKEMLAKLQAKAKQEQKYHSISIPSDYTPAVMTASVDDWLFGQSYTPAFIIPALDNDHFVIHGRESLLSSGKLNHLK